jgi:hypothetical protein
MIKLWTRRTNLLILMIKKRVALGREVAALVKAEMDDSGGIRPLQY